MDMPKRFPTPDNDDIKEVFNALRHIVRAARASSHEVKGALGISGSQLFVLQQLIDHPRVSLRELAALTLTDQSSVSVVVGRLVRQRLVTRTTSAEDGRRLEVSLTARGRAFLKNPPEVVQLKLLRSLRSVPKPQLRTLRLVMNRIVRDLGLEAVPAEMFFEYRGPMNPSPSLTQPRRKRRQETTP
jgi:DNA-binding MarR family transcriptional regulator